MLPVQGPDDPSTDRAAEHEYSYPREIRTNDWFERIAETVEELVP